MITSMRFRVPAALLAGLFALTLATPSFAEPARRPEGAKEQSSEVARLPADVTTDHTLELPDRTLRFKATAGSLPINTLEGKLQAEIAYIAYERPDTEAAARPLTFVFNGGPGAASAYLQLGAMGPWRLPLDNITPSSTAATIPNPETWLDFTDLVFVDPVGSGYSRFINTSDEVRKQFWSVDGDIRTQVDREERTTSVAQIHRR
jgi:carboxypeptidase C (cathepsin A)